MFRCVDVLGHTSLSPKEIYLAAATPTTWKVHFTLNSVARRDHESTIFTRHYIEAYIEIQYKRPFYSCTAAEHTDSTCLEQDTESDYLLATIQLSGYLERARLHRKHLNLDIG